MEIQFDLGRCDLDNYSSIRTLNTTTNNISINSTVSSPNNNQMEFSLDVYFIFLATFVCFMGSYNTVEIIQNLKYISNKNSIVMLLFLSSIMYASVTFWGPYFIMLNSIYFLDIKTPTEISIDLRLIIFSILSAILCNVSGFCIAFLPFMDRNYNQFKHFILNKIYSGSFNPLKINANYSKFKTFTFKKYQTQNLNLSNYHRNNSTFYINNNDNSNNKTYEINNNLNNKNQIINKNNSENYSGSNNTSIENPQHLNYNEANQAHSGREKNQKNAYDQVFKKNKEKPDLVNHDANANINAYSNYFFLEDNNFNLINDRNTVEEFDFSNYFLRNNLRKKEIIYYVIGGIIIGSSNLIIHFLIIFSIKMKDYEISINIPIQILICFISFCAAILIHFAFYYRNKFLLKIGVSFTITLLLSMMQLISIKFINFSHIQTVLPPQALSDLTKNTDDIYQDEEFDFKGFIKLKDIFNAMIIIIIVFPFISKDILYKNLKKSNKIISYIKNFAKKGIKEWFFIIEFAEFLKPMEFFHDKELRNFNKEEIEEDDYNNEKINRNSIIKEVQPNIMNDNDYESNINENNANIKNNNYDYEQGNNNSTSNINDLRLNNKNKKDYLEKTKNYNSNSNELIDQEKNSPRANKRKNISKFNTNFIQQ